MSIPAAIEDLIEILMSHRKSILRLTVIFVCLSLALPVRAQQYSFRYYGTEDGLTNLAVKVLFQDRTGFLWAGTESGLFRYDGQRFQRYGPAEGLAHQVVVSLGEAPDGSVLAGYREGVYQQKGNRFEKVPLLGARGVDGYGSILFDGIGRTFVATEVGLIEATTSGEGGSLALRLLPTPASAEGARPRDFSRTGGYVVWLRNRLVPHERGRSYRLR